MRQRGQYLRRTRATFVIAMALVVALGVSCTTEPGPDNGSGPQPGDCNIAPRLVGPGFHVHGVSNSGNDVFVFDRNMEDADLTDLVHIDTSTLERRVLHSLDGNTDDYRGDSFKLSADGSRYLIEYWSSKIVDSEIFGQITVGATDNSWHYDIPMPYEYMSYFTDPDLTMVGLQLFQDAPPSVSPLYYVDPSGVTADTFNLEGPPSYYVRHLSDDLSLALWQGWGFNPRYGFLIITDTATGEVVAERNNFPIAEGRLSTFFMANDHVVINTGRPHVPEGEFNGADAFIWDLHEDSISPFDTGHERASIEWLSADSQRQIYLKSPGRELRHRTPTTDRLFADNIEAQWSYDGTAGATTDGEFVYIHCLATS